MRYIYEQLRKRGKVKNGADFSRRFLHMSRVYYSNMLRLPPGVVVYARLYVCLTLAGETELAKYAFERLVAEVLKGAPPRGKNKASDKRWDVV